MKNYFLLFSVLLSLPVLVPVTAQPTASSADYLAALRRTGPYDTTQEQIPAFTYQSASDPHLTELRTSFNLDSVAGKGTDSERAIRLLQWMHNAVPHDDVDNIPVLNAKNIITAYRKENIAQGCYPLSIAMNEIFLSMGFKSRSVICFSSNYLNPNGGHVINIVYINSLKKWVWMDPQENAYVMDEHGNLLDIAEVRERLINDKPLTINATANYHNIPTKKEEYLYNFMAEHMYRFICPLHSEYDSQTRSKGKILQYVELLPINSGKLPVDNFETKKHDFYEVINYHTNNDVVFWK